MITYPDLFSFVIMLCSVITLVITVYRHKKQRPHSDKVKRYFYNKIYFTGGQVVLTSDSLVKHIIVNPY